MSLSGWAGFILGLVQGLTEFLPISSSGHLVLAERLVGFAAQGVVVEVAVHVATLLSVIIAYRTRIVRLLADLFRGGREGWGYAGMLLLASVPAGVAGVLWHDYFERTFHSLGALGWNFLVTAGFLWSTRWAPRRPAAEPPGQPSAEIPESRVTVWQAVVVGLAQALAILPGISRSGATISAGLWVGLPAAKAAEFSFLMAIIVIAGSGLLEARNLAGASLAGAGLLVAFLTAMISGVIAIRLLVLLLRHGRFHWFAPYAAALGILCLVWFS